MMRSEGGPDAEGSPEIPAVGDLKRKSRRMTKAVEMEVSTAGGVIADLLRSRLIDLLNDSARMEGIRRGATILDKVDYERGFDSIANPSRRQKVVGITADVAGHFGAGSIGYAINIFTSDSPTRSAGYIAIGAGVVLIGIGLVLKWFLPGR